MHTNHISDLETSSYQLDPRISLTQFDSSSEKQSYLAVLPSGRHFQLSEPLYLLMTCLVKPKTLVMLVDEMQAKTGRVFESAQLQNLIETKLKPQGFIRFEGQERVYSSQDMLSLRFYRDIVPAHLLTPITDRLKFLFLRPVAVALLLLILIVHWFVYAQLNLTQYVTAESMIDPIVFGLFIVTAVIHELGHLSACRRWSCPHGALGVGIYFFKPVMYVDVTQAWRLTRLQRAVIDLGGLYFQLLLIIPFALLYLAYQQPLFLIVIFLIDLSLITNLNPFVKFDGYWLLSDLVGIPNLHKRVGQILGYQIIHLRWRIQGKKLPPQQISTGLLGNRARKIIIGYGIIGFFVLTTFMIIALPTLFNAAIQFPGLLLDSAAAFIESSRELNVSDALTYGLRTIWYSFILIYISTAFWPRVKQVFDRPIKQNQEVTMKTASSISTRGALYGFVGGIFISSLIVMALIWWAPGLVQNTIRNVHGDGTGIPIGREAPNFVLNDLDNNRYELEDLIGTPIVLKFWSTTCPNCIEELPIVSEIYNEVKDEVIFLSVSGGNIEELKTFVIEEQIEYPVLFDETADLFRDYNLRGVPTTYIIDSNGVVQEFIEGSLTKEQYTEMISQACSSCSVPDN